MDKFREFQGKDLDECINAACAFFDAPREKLEIEIVQDAKSGIFGIVLARKAKIRARRAQLKEAVRDILDSAQDKPKAEKSYETQQKKSPPRDGEKKNRPLKDAKQRHHAPKHEHAEEAPEKKAQAPAPENRKDVLENKIPESQDAADFDMEDEGLPLRPMEDLDGEKVTALTKEVVSTLVRPIAGHDVSVDVTTGHGSIHARVDWKGDAGLLIGREGQTLAALQYLASRMLSHAFNAALRVQLDIGDYRRRQDEKLRELALSLAEKARQTGRSWSTRPLSSYHRRIIHMALQDAPDVQTRSSGDGPLKRVVISPRRHNERE